MGTFRLTGLALVFCIFNQLILDAQTRDISGLPIIRNYPSTEYNAGIQNWSISQDQDGIIYVANNLGLLSYDGQNWKSYQVTNRAKVRATYINGKDRIYTGSQGDFGFFEKDEQGQLIYTSLADSLESADRNFDETWNILGDGKYIYFCTFSRIFLYDGQAIHTLQPEHQLEISFSVDNRVITQEWGFGLSEVNKSGFQLIENGDYFKDKRVSSILKLDRDKWLISTFNHGLFTYEQGRLEAFRLKGSSQQSFTYNYANRLENGDIAIGTQNNGLLIVDPNGNLEMSIDKSSGLHDNTVNHIFEDYEGNLWTSLNNGIARIDLNSPFSLIDSRHGIDGSGYTAYPRGNNVLLGTNNGLFELGSDGITFIEGSEGQVYSIDRINNRYLIGHHLGSFELTGSKLVRLSDEKGAWMFRQHPSDKDKIIGGNYNGLRLYESPTKSTKIEGFTESARIMEFDGNHLWVTHGYKGAYRLSLSEDFKTVTNTTLFNGANGFPSDLLINAFKISNRLIFTSESGFYEFDEDQEIIKPFPSFSELIGYESSIVDMEEDELGNIYFIEQNQIGILKHRGNLNFELHANAFNKIQSFWNDDLGNISVIDNDNILIGGRDGFIHYKPSKDIPKTIPFRVLISEVKNLGSNELLIQNLNMAHEGVLEAPTLPYIQNSMAFKFSAPHFESEKNMLFQYRLENYTDDWSDWTSNNMKEFSNLKEGDYVFQVRAKNIFNQVSPPLTYEFTISPPIYRTTAAYGFYGVGSLTLLFLLFKTLDSKHKRTTRQLTESKDQEISKRDSQIKTISRQSEEEIMRLKNENLKAEIALKGQELTSSAMHLIQKNQLLSQIKGTIKTLTKDVESDEISKKLNRIIKSIDRDRATGEEWDQFQNNFDLVHGSFITRLKTAYPGLTPQEVKFSAYIRMNLNTKEIAELLNISVRGVEIGRYRIRKKLELKRSENLADFILRF